VIVTSKLKKIGIIILAYPNITAALFYAVVILGMFNELIRGRAHWSWYLLLVFLLCLFSFLSWIMLTKRQTWRWALFDVVVLAGNVFIFKTMLFSGD
jgi:hypothetical protein